MKTSSTEKIQKAVLEVQFDTLTDVQNKLEDRIEKIRNLLYSKTGTKIYLNTYGERFDRIHEKRQDMWKIIDIYTRTIIMIDVMKEEIREQF